MNTFKRIHSLQGLDNFTETDNTIFWQKMETMKNQQQDVVLRFLGLSTTDACNYNCIYCYGTEAANRNSKQPPLSLEEQTSLIDQGIELGVRTVIICGNGEPTIDKDLLGIVKHAANKGLYSIILTNGNTLGNDAMAQRIYKMSSRDVATFLHDNNVSLIIKTESITEDMYNGIVQARGKENHFRSFMSAIDNVIQLGFTDPTHAEPVHDGTKPTRLCISSVICKKNFFKINNIKDWAHGIGAQFVCKLPTLSGNSKDNLDEFFETNSTTHWLKENYGTEYSEKPETLSTDIHHCGAFHFGVVIGNTGDIRHCYPMAAKEDEAVGNIRQKPLKDLLLDRSQKFGSQLAFGAKCHVKKNEYIPIIKISGLTSK